MPVDWNQRLACPAGCVLDIGYQMTLTGPLAEHWWQLQVCPQLSGHEVLQNNISFFRKRHALHSLDVDIPGDGNLSSPDI